MKYFIGCDCSLNGFGVSILSEDKKIILTEVIKPKKIKAQEEKIKNIQLHLTHILEHNIIDECIIEDTYFARNPVTTKLLTRISGVVIALLNNYNIPYRFITTCTMKAHILGTSIKQPKVKRKKGEKAIKQPKIDFKEMQRLFIIKYFNLPQNTLNDTTDSIGLCLIGIDNVYDKPKVKKQKKSI